ncbi:MAG: hypothetical protein WAN03_00365, partial [Candidatus Sulfotelmatobacter sp.]
MIRRLIWLAALLLSISACATSQNSAAPDPYKPTLDHLQSLLQRDEEEWRWHSDVPHPEDPGMNDSEWNEMAVKNAVAQNDQPDWKGTRVFRRWIQIPE